MGVNAKWPPIDGQFELRTLHVFFYGYWVLVKLARFDICCRITQNIEFSQFHRNLISIRNIWGPSSLSEENLIKNAMKNLYLVNDYKSCQNGIFLKGDIDTLTLNTFVFYFFIFMCLFYFLKE